jgi:transcriptional regulator NrdR family protein
MTIQQKAHDVCFKCGGIGRVYKTRKYSETYIIRYHRCEDCGRKFQTEEQRKPRPVLMIVRPPLAAPG